MAQIDTNPFLAPQEKFSNYPEQPSPFSGRRIVFWGISVLVIGTLFVFLIAPLSRVGPGREALRRYSCQNNLKQIAIALHNYEREHGSFPPAYTIDEHGAPLHSWRVLILPYIEQNELYKSIDLTKPWNDPTNEKVRRQTPVVYRCPSSPCSDGFTTYLANAWEKGAFVPGVGKSFEEFTDGDFSTIAVFEVTKDQAVEWMSPQDGDYETYLKVIASPSLPHGSAINVAMVDGSAHTFSNPSKSSSGTYLPFFTIAEGDKAER